MQQRYPDISDLFEAKAQRRRELAALTWEEKIRIVEQMQRLLPKGAWQIKRDGTQRGIVEVREEEDSNDSK